MFAIYVNVVSFLNKSSLLVRYFYKSNKTQFTPTGWNGPSRKQGKLGRQHNQEDMYAIKKNKK